MADEGRGGAVAGAFADRRPVAEEGRAGGCGDAGCVAVSGTYADSGSTSDVACGLLIGMRGCCKGGVRGALPWALPPGTFGLVEECMLGEFGDEVAPTMADTGTCTHELSSLTATPSVTATPSADCVLASLGADAVAVA